MARRIEPIEWRGHSFTSYRALAQASPVGINARTLKWRLHMGIDLETAMTAPCYERMRGKRKMVEYQGQMVPMGKLVRLRVDGVSPHLVYDRINLGWSAEAAVSTPARPWHHHTTNWKKKVRENVGKDHKLLREVAGVWYSRNLGREIAATMEEIDGETYCAHSKSYDWYVHSLGGGRIETYTTRPGKDVKDGIRMYEVNAHDGHVGLKQVREALV